MDKKASYVKILVDQSHYKSFVEAQGLAITLQKKLNLAEDEIGKLKKQVRSGGGELKKPSESKNSARKSEVEDEILGGELRGGGIETNQGIKEIELADALAGPSIQSFNALPEAPVAETADFIGDFGDDATVFGEAAPELKGGSLKRKRASSTVPSASSPTSAAELLLQSIWGKHLLKAKKVLAVLLKEGYTISPEFMLRGPKVKGSLYLKDVFPFTFYHPKKKELHSNIEEWCDLLVDLHLDSLISNEELYKHFQWYYIPM
jgi:hypothetical protein